MSLWDQCPAVLVGLIGSGIGASRTPAMHEREGAEQGLRRHRRQGLTDLIRVDLTHQVPAGDQRQAE